MGFGDNFKKWLNGEATEESFAELAKTYSADGKIIFNLFLPNIFIKCFWS